MVYRVSVSGCQKMGYANFFWESQIIRYFIYKKGLKNVLEKISETKKYFESRATVNLRIPIGIRDTPNFAYPYFSEHCPSL